MRGRDDGDAAAGPDEWDVVLDEEFIKGGRTEATAQERAEHAARIHREHQAAASWRADPARPEPPSNGGTSRSVGLKALAVVTVAVLLVVGWGIRGFLAEEPDENPTSATAVEESASPTEEPDPVSDQAPLGTPAPVPAGEGDVRYLAFRGEGNEPVSFDPCQRLHYVVRPDNAPTGGTKALRAGLAELSRTTGLVLVDDGATDEDPSDNRPISIPERYDADYAPVLISWSDEKESPDLAGYIIGVTGARSVHLDGRPDTEHWVTGQVVLDAPDFRRVLKGPNGQVAARATVLHELGHLVGLNHVSDRGQIMFSESLPNVTKYGVGDLTGLNKLGQGPCFSS